MMKQEEKKPHKIFVQGPISPSLVAESIAKHQSKTNIGAHAIFLGQVRNDVLNGKEVIAIDYSSYEPMAEMEAHNIREAIFAKHDLTCMHIYHSIGRVNKGEISLFIFISSKHRKPLYKALEELVDEIKEKVPIWGKEIFADGDHTWKENK